MAPPRKTTAKSSTDAAASFEVITPELASEYLHSNLDNQRTISQLVIERYVRSMREGLWRVNGEAIKFDINGKLCDGQHRLTSCIAADKSFETLVIRGLETEVFDSLDTGKQRSAGDVLRMMGVKSHFSISAAVRIWVAISRLDDKDVFWEIKPSLLGITNHSIRDHYLKASKKGGGNHWEQSGVIVLRDYTKFVKLVGPSTAIFAYMMLTHIDHDRALSFFKGLESGMPQLRDRSRNKYCPSALVKEALVDIKLGGATGKIYHRLVLHKKLAAIFEGWNYFVQDVCMNQLVKKVDGPLPMVENSPILKVMDNFGRLI